MHKAWWILLAAGLFECAWAVGLKYTDGFTRLLPLAFTLVAMGISVWLLSLAMRSIEVGTAYAVWTGIGAAGVALIGILFLKEPAGAGRLMSLLLIVAGVAGLRYFSLPGSG